MIIGTGIDVVDVNRFMETLDRTPRLREKLFTEVERELPAASLAARFAAKEAIAKSLGAPGNLRWHDVTVHRTVGARPGSTPPAPSPPAPPSSACAPGTSRSRTTRASRRRW
nr:hypothetical protein GCM10025730_24630 [Promicromonospora thailandica]